MSKPILVIGATGLLGEPVTRRLQADGMDVRIMARDPDKARRLLGPSFDVVAGDVARSRDLEEALDGCQGVHISLAGEMEQPGTEQIAALAARKGLSRITYVSGTSVCEENAWFPLVRQKWLAEKAIRESSVPYTIFCPTWFMEVLGNFVKGSRAFIFGKQARPYHLVAASDFARMVSAAYRTEEAANKRLTVHGPEAIMLRDAITQYCVALHPDIKGVTALPYWLAGIIARLKGSEEMKFAVSFMAYFEQAGERGDAAEADRILGAPCLTLAEWLKERHHPGPQAAGMAAR